MLWNRLSRLHCPSGCSLYIRLHACCFTEYDVTAVPSSPPQANTGQAGQAPCTQTEA